MRRRSDREKWFWIALMIVAVAIMVGLTVWPWLGPGVDGETLTLDGE